MEKTSLLASTQWLHLALLPRAPVILGSRLSLMTSASSTQTSGRGRGGERWCLGLGLLSVRLRRSLHSSCTHRCLSQGKGRGRERAKLGSLSLSDTSVRKSIPGNVDSMLGRLGEAVRTMANQRADVPSSSCVLWGQFLEVFGGN